MILQGDNYKLTIKYNVFWMNSNTDTALLQADENWQGTKVRRICSAAMNITLSFVNREMLAVMFIWTGKRRKNQTDCLTY
jgi:hypothetical protein